MIVILSTLILIATLTYQPSPRAAYHLILLIASAGLYALPVPVDKIRLAVRWLAVPVFAVVILGAWWDNGNTMAMWVWALWFFCWDRFEPETVTAEQIIWYGLAGWAMFCTKSEGGLIAVLAGILAQWYGRRGVAGAAVAGFGVVLLKINSFGSAGIRIEMLRHALDGFLRQPLGHGLGQYVFWSDGGWGAWHPHNIIADAGYSLGVGGLALLGLSAWLCWHANKPAWTVGFLTAFAVHSLVDGPIWYIWPLLILTLKEAKVERYCLSVWGAVGADIRRYRPGPAVAVETPLGLDARPAGAVGADERG